MKRKRLSHFVLFVAAMLLASVCNAQTFKVDGISYHINNINHTCEVVGIDREMTGDLVVPSAVIYKLEKYTVTTIESFACAECEKITSIQLPSTIDFIGSGAFHDCTSVKSVKITAEYPIISSGAFQGCTSLKNVQISGALHYLEPFTFSGCCALESIEMPDQNLLKIGEKCFEGCQSLKSFKMPNTVTSVGNDAFRFCTSLTDVTISENIQGSLWFTFEGCTALENVIVPSDNLWLTGTFKNCTSLKSATIEGDVLSLGAFEGCTALKTVKVNGTCDMLDGAFVGCTQLESFIHGDIRRIGQATFSGCKSLKEIELNTSLTYLGEDAFEGCESLKSITMPSSLETIAKRSFADCKSLESVSFHQGTKEIEPNAFWDCDNIRDVYIYSTEPMKLAANSFSVYKNLHVPVGSKDVWENATSWNKFNIIDDIVGIPIEKIELSLKYNPDGIDVHKCAVGQEIEIIASILPDNATNKSLRWSCDNGGVTFKNHEGTSAFITGLRQGTTIITATSTDGTNISATIPVQVYMSTDIEEHSADPAPVVRRYTLSGTSAQSSHKGIIIEKRADGTVRKRILK